MSQVLGVKFNDFGQIYYFSSGPFVVCEGHSVIVKTEQGMGLGKVFVVQQDLPEDVSEESLKTIYRLAGDEDLESEAENRDLSRVAHRFCKDCIDRQKLDMKLVDVEVFFDRSKMIFYFTAPGRIDFRELVKELVKEYRTRIELRQIGVRHETQMLGAIGNCGQICCCRRFMRKFMPVTIRMAKEQNLFLNPTKISGICGRLLCCLSFEQDNYEDFHRKCPKIGKRYNTVHGSVRVTRSNFFRNALTVLPEEGEEIEISLDEWPDILRQQAPARGGRGDSAEQEPEENSRSSRTNMGNKAKVVPGRDNQSSRGKATAQSVPENRSVDVSAEEGAGTDSVSPVEKSGPADKADVTASADQKTGAAVKDGDAQKKGGRPGPAREAKGAKTRRPTRRRRKRKPSGSRKN
ncbi:regulatory iron-sulfur-containing complex subunit RicT [Maridesulfovibrio sp.]|uniref:PSP1 domain-containing protein n=1 Tax=Maridesulfovibrio sp. TaxID=2795000 RepID=UPI002A18793B|nr:regulatory iron-sulfur-containing complex subunit RicT [Maridesulfovibrio sp.]